LPQLITLLQDAVADGASLGFLAPLPDDDARSYWKRVIDDVARKTQVLLVALEDGQIIGSVQLALATKPNALHRCEVQKLCVHTAARKRGVGRALMIAVEDAARQAHRTLLVLDTRRGDPADHLYASLGYTVAGTIPRFTLDTDGQFHDTVLLYRDLV
jgi:ribosomal protein S18 acetylase RimI-like enzyme